MAALNPTKSLLHSSSDQNSPSLFKSHLDSVSFKRTHLGFEPKIRTRGAYASSLVGERIRKTEYVNGSGKQRGGLAVNCTAEGIERGLLVGGRGEEGRFVLPERFKVVALMACAMCLCNADRVVMSVAIVPLAAKHGWSSSFLGIVQLTSVLRASSDEIRRSCSSWNHAGLSLNDTEFQLGVRASETF